MTEGAAQADRDRIERGVENLMGTGVTDPSVWRFTGSRTVFAAAADLCRYLSRQGGLDRAALVEALHTEDREAHYIQDVDEYKLFAEFRCTPCGRSWKSGLAWGVFDSRLQPTCTCLTHPLPGRELRTTEEHLRRKGCVHVFRNPEQCEQVDVDLATQREVLDENNDASVRLQRVATRVCRSGMRPREDAGPPRQGCQECGRMSDAIYCQLADKSLQKPHKPALCPKCVRTGHWCHGAIHKPDIVMRYALVASLLDSSVAFRPSEAGLEAAMQYEGYQVLLLLRPWLYIVPEHRRPFTTTGQEGEVLRPDRQPAGADEQSMFKRALQVVMSRRAEATQWPESLSLTEIVSALQAFAAQGAATSPASDATAMAVQAALEQRDMEALQRAMEHVQVTPSTGANDSSPSLADRFKGFLQLRSISARSSGSSASSSDQVPSPPVTASTQAHVPSDSDVQAFALASQCMGGRLTGPWRCFRVDEKKHYGQRHGHTYWKPHGWVKRRLHVDDYERCRTWPIAYHGTTSENAAKVLLTNLRRPGVGGATQAHVLLALAPSTSLPPSTTQPIQSMHP